MGTFGSTFSQHSKGGLISSIIPASNDLLFWLDGTIIDVSGTKYFVDKSGHGRHFLITSYDFDGSWTTGFPYKSLATISAPAGDTTLISADINNFLYTGGTPNQIPVVSLFQDIDYEHKIFTRHGAQVLDGNQVETYEPRVLDIVMYSSVRSGNALTACQTYFGVPAEITSNVIWVSKTGNDTTGTGTKAAPYLTMQKAYGVAQLYPIYVKTGVYAETNGAGYLSPGRTKKAIALGLCSIKAVSSGSQAILINAAITLDMEGFIIGNDASPLQTVNNLNASGIITLNKCKLNLGTYAISAAASPSITLTNCIFTGQTNRILNSTLTTAAITFNSNVSSLTISTIIAAGGTTIAKYNKIATLSLSNSSAAAVVTAFNNKVINYISASTGAKAGSSFTCQRNIVIGTSGSGLNIGNTNFGTTDIQYNYFEGAPYLDIYDQDTLYVKNNFLINKSSGNCGMALKAATSQQKYFEIENNVILATDGFSPIQVGSDAITAFDNTFTGRIRGNVAINQSSNYPHGIVVFNHTNISITHNYIEKYSFGALHKVDGLDLSTAPIMYNISVGCGSGISTKGGQNQLIANNTIINAVANGFYGTKNNLGSLRDSLNTTLKNNIIYDSGASRSYYNITIDSGGTLTSDNNVIYSVNNADKYFQTAAITKAQWLALGRDSLSQFTNPNLSATYVPNSPIAIGASLGDSYKSGLDVTTVWGSQTTLPNITYRDQSGTWQLGAFIQ